MLEPRPRNNRQEEEDPENDDFTVFGALVARWSIAVDCFLADSNLGFNYRLCGRLGRSCSTIVAAERFHVLTNRGSCTI